MSRISKCLCALLALIVWAVPALAYDDLISPENIVADSANYKTVTVERGVYQKTGQASASVFYPTQYTVRYEGAKAHFVSFAVRRGDEVKKGTLLATFSVDRDEVAITTRQLQLQRAKENRETELLSRAEAISEQERLLAAESDLYQREILKLQLEKLRLDAERYDYDSLHSIQSMQDALDELLSSYENQFIYAPCDGVVSDVTYMRDNETVWDGTYLMTMYDPMDVLFRITDEQGVLRYNMPVTISVGPNNSRVEGRGRVVASYNVLPGKGTDKYAYVRVTDYNADEVKSLLRPNASYTAAYLGNVITVPKNATTLFSGKYHVYKLSQNGMVSKRYITYGLGNVATGVWVLDGLQPGDVLILN